MSFWDNISRSTLRDVAHAAGMRTSPALAVEDLEKHYGSTPGPEFIDEMWLVLRDGWLTRSAADRDAIVKGMLAKGRGNAESLRLSTRAGQIQYLKTLHRGRGLTEVVLPVFLASGAAERLQPVYSEPPASPQEQARRFEDALRAGLAAVSAANVGSLEFAVLTALDEGIGKLSLPPTDPAQEASRILSEVLNTFTFATPELSQDNLLDYQSILVERIPQRLASADLIGSTFSLLHGALQSALSDPSGDPLSCITWFSAVFWSVLAYGEKQSTPDDFIEKVRNGQRRFLATDSDPSGTADTADTAGGLADVLLELMATIPNVTAPRRIDDGALKWSVYMGSAVVDVALLPESKDAPAKITFVSPLVKGITPSADLADVLNSANAKETLIKFYRLDDVIVLEQEFLTYDLNDALFRYMLGRFATAADYFDTVLKDLFGGSLSGADQKAFFDA